ncbi:MAG: cell division protein FtsQ [Alphaproteobacteria bacterium]|nr:MAG: cell division protein FtsQ [Alphaproteobacteria bacterium]
MRALIPLRRRRDPAPSRLRYRLARLWLRPWLRSAVTLWLPVAVIGVSGWAVLSQPLMMGRMRQAFDDIRASILAQPELMLQGLAITGGSQALHPRIAEAVGVGFPVSSLALDLDAVRARIEAISAVAEARVSVGPDRRLVISIREREPAAILRRGGTLYLVDRDGVLIAQLAQRAARPELPVLAGEGAEDHVREALRIVQVARPIAGRLRGLVRVGARRWDLVLNRDQRIQLPEDDPVLALRRVLAFNEAEHLLDRDIRRIDMRDRTRPVLQLGPDALRALRPAEPAPEGEET